MSKITQYSRISHHTITGSMSATFSVPLSEDFTDGTWNVRDLSLSEIGVNEDSKKAYIRINDEVKEIQLAGGTSSSEPLSTVLAAGNTTGLNNIIVNSPYKIKTEDTGYIQFGDGTIGGTNSIVISNGNNGVTTPIANLTVSGTDAYISANATDIVSTNIDSMAVDPSGVGFGTGFRSYRLGTGQSSQTFIPTQIDMSVTDNVLNNTIFTQVDDGFSLSATDGTNTATSEINKSFLNLTYTDSIFSNLIEITDNKVNISTFDGVVETSILIGTNYKIVTTIKDLSVVKSADLVQTINNTTTTLLTSIGAFISSAIYFKAYVTAVDTTLTNVYGAELFGVFKNNVGVITQISTTDKVEKTSFITATSDIDTDGTNIRVRVTGELLTTINWEVRVEYNT